jgi:hypothetical protein
MTERDGEVLLSVYKHRFLTVTQIQRLHFPSMQTAYRRTRLLRLQGLLVDFAIPSIDEAVITIGKKGLIEIAGLLGVEQSELRWSDTKNKPRDYYFMRHFLAINNFRIQLARDCENSGIKLLGFIPDYFGERTRAGGTTKYIKDVVCDIEPNRPEISHTPDGVFALERNGKAALFFVEVDRGTEGISDPTKGVLKAIRFYAQYLVSGKYQRYAVDFKTDQFKGFRALFVTTSDVRVKNIRTVVSNTDIPSKAKLFVWLTTFEAIDKYGLFAPVWLSSDVADMRTYKIG